MVRVMSQKQVRVFGLKKLFLKRFTVRSTTRTIIADKNDHSAFTAISSYLPADDQNTTRAGGNNPRARCAICSRDTTIRICSVSPLTGKNQFIKISAWEEVISRAKYFS
jgi:hypothetical protein